MISALNHIALIVSSRKHLAFYEKLGFHQTAAEERGYDSIHYYEGYGLTLEIYVDPKHPPRVTNPEAMGLRHFALGVDDLPKTLKELSIETEPIREKDGKKYTFFKDPDGLPIELREV